MSAATSALKMMYNMERLATALYKAQPRAFHEEETLKRLAAAAANEQQHVDNLSSRIIELGGSPSRVGFLFQTAGAIFGFLVTFAGRVIALRTNVWIEKRAIRDYGSYMQRLKFDEDTVGLLQRIVTDEERHVATWQDSIARIKPGTNKD
jgi:demethoxyubiquinone hydroxylase (CLK1/Coq7/Cat5 family)